VYGCVEVALKKLTARGNIHLLERVSKQLEIRVFERQTRGLEGSGHIRIYPQSASHAGVGGGHCQMAHRETSKLDANLQTAINPRLPRLGSAKSPRMLLQKG
jgi:hypothetical protein